ncbi:FkbM family methyltransferase [Hyphobacterium sp.]|uniref:FkbM family methyltransferase n=1 Tax=Hyphobacterium sp. TaxID=2004662 RepID=UPI003BA9B08C
MNPNRTASIPLTFAEQLKRFFVPAKYNLERITARELKCGEPEIHLLQVLVDRKRTAFDIGANRGIWAHVMSRYTETVWAFEPNPVMFDWLQRGVSGKIKCLSYALSDRDGPCELLIPGKGRKFSNQGASLSETKVGDCPHLRIHAERIRLDQLDPPPVGFMKIDVEGHEREVLAGAAATIARDRPVMIIELEERHTGRRIEDELDHVETFGYDTFVLKDGTLHPRSAFDADVDHRQKAGQSGYLNNFVFRPRA